MHGEDACTHLVGSETLPPYATWEYFMDQAAAPAPARYPDVCLQM